MKRFVLCLVAACATETAEDGRDDQLALGGKADGGLVLTPAELSKMFSVASQFDAEGLADEVGLSRRAARAIAAKATGPDGGRGTVDDTYFRTLEELDAVPYVGPYALAKLQAYVHSAGLVDPMSSTRWHVETTTAFEVSAGPGIPASRPDFAIDRTGKTIALYQVDKRKLMLSIDGQELVVPTNDASFDPYQKPRVVVDATNTIHVFTRVFAPAGSQHLTYRSGQWSDLGFIQGYLDIASNSAGAIYGLARGERQVGSTFVDFFELHHIASTVSQASVEPLPATAAIFSTDVSEIAVGADGVPVITWLHGTCKSHSCGIESLQLLRRTTSGFSGTSVAARPSWQRTGTAIATGGGPNAIVLLTQDVPERTVTVLAESAGTFVATSGVPDGALPLGLGTPISVIVDAQGVLHACANPQSTSSLNVIEVDSARSVDGNQLTEGRDAGFCTMVTDAGGQANVIYGSGRVYIRASRQ